jgi:hypothetical protein
MTRQHYSSGRETPDMDPRLPSYDERVEAWELEGIRERVEAEAADEAADNAMWEAEQAMCDVERRAAA